jgi:adenylate cyclase
MVAMRREDGSYATPKFKKPVPPRPTGASSWMWPVAVMVVCLVAIGVAGFLYFTKLELRHETRESAVANSNAAPSASPIAAPPVTPSVAAAASSSPTSSPQLPSNERFSAESVPFVTDKIRIILANEYVAAAEPKAFALNLNGIIGLSSSQPNEEAAKSAALELCQKRVDNVKSPRKCELYAVGSAVVYPHGRPPVPPLPWIRRDTATEKPFASKDMPFARDTAKARLESNYVPGKKSKAVVVGPGGNFIFYTDGATVAETVRRALETCGSLAGVPCMIVAVDDVFVVPVPTIMKATGFFRPTDNPSIAADARADVTHQFADASSGWNAVAVGSSGRPGLALKAVSEQDAVNGALSDCTKRDSNCHVIAIGPFEVGPN